MARLISTGRIVHPGRKVMMGEAEVVSEKGKLVAKATSTLMVLEEGPAD
jgi:acyl-coenzyme A thioesterase PaaI-like protein